MPSGHYASLCGAGVRKIGADAILISPLKQSHEDDDFHAVAKRRSDDLANGLHVVVLGRRSQFGGIVQYVRLLWRAIAHFS
jgi:hypothetical protein